MSHADMQTQSGGEAAWHWNFRSLGHVRSAAKVNSVSYGGGAAGDSALRGHQDASIPGGHSVAGLRPRCDYVGAN